MAPGTSRKVLVAMSGGVDSAVAAALLQDDGYEVVGCFMRLGSADEAPETDPQTDPDTGKRSRSTGCCSLNDACDARLVAATLDVPFYVLNFRRQFERIIDYFVSEYNAGRTPNPCIRCNQWLKFGRLLAYARSIDAEYVATGHHARIDRVPGDAEGRSRLLRGVDAGKDQSYVLFNTRRETLRHMLLPIGRYRKSQIRQIARDRGLPVYDKPDSQEICFVPDNNYAGLIERRSPDRVRPGAIVDVDGRSLGEHGGHQHFTIGQRRGLNLSLGHPVYVVNKDAAANTVTVGASRDTEASGLAAGQANWLRTPPIDGPIRCLVQVRSNGAPQPASVRAVGADTLHARFDRPQRAISPGQAVVCYDGEELIGGGWIEEARHD